MDVMPLQSLQKILNFHVAMNFVVFVLLIGSKDKQVQKKILPI